MAKDVQQELLAELHARLDDMQESHSPITVMRNGEHVAFPIEDLGKIKKSLDPSVAGGAPYFPLIIDGRLYRVIVKEA